MMTDDTKYMGQFLKIDTQAVLVLLDNTKNSLRNGTFTQDRELVEQVIETAEHAIEPTWGCLDRGHNNHVVTLCVECGLAIGTEN